MTMWDVQGEDLVPLNGSAYMCVPQVPTGPWQGTEKDVELRARDPSQVAIVRGQVTRQSG